MQPNLGEGAMALEDCFFERFVEVVVFVTQWISYEGLNVKCVC